MPGGRRWLSPGDRGDGRQQPASRRRAARTHAGAHDRQHRLPVQRRSLL